MKQKVAPIEFSARFVFHAYNQLCRINLLKNRLIVLGFVLGDELLVFPVVITSIFQCSSVVLYMLMKMCIYHGTVVLAYRCVKRKKIGMINQSVQCKCL